MCDFGGQSNEDRKNHRQDTTAKAPFKPVDFLLVNIGVEHRADGTLVLRNSTQLQPFERQHPAFLMRWVTEVPDRVFIAQRRGPERPAPNGSRDFTPSRRNRT